MLQPKGERERERERDGERERERETFERERERERERASHGRLCSQLTPWGDHKEFWTNVTCRTRWTPTEMMQTKSNDFGVGDAFVINAWC